jgi:serine/threonine protein kinase
MGGINCTKAVDMYSFGVLCYEITTGAEAQGWQAAPALSSASCSACFQKLWKQHAPESCPSRLSGGCKLPLPLLPSRLDSCPVGCCLQANARCEAT